MDVLDKYKKAWKNQPEDFKKVSRDEIFKMTHARSSSIVKWIFIIGLFEFALLILVYCFFDFEESMKKYEELKLKNFMIVLQAVSFIFFFYFLYQFYVNFKNISVVENTKSLMTKILKTRKTVKNYVVFSLTFAAISIVAFITSMVINNANQSASKPIVITILVLFIVSVICLGILWLFYQLLYGILLRKLNKNYKELAKLDELN